MKGYRLLRKDSKKVRKGLSPSLFFLWEHSNTRRGCPERLWSHKESKLYWKWATCSRWSCLSRKTGLVHLKNCLPTSTILWSCGIQFHLIWFLIHLKYQSKASPVTYALQLYSWHTAPLQTHYLQLSGLTEIKLRKAYLGLWPSTVILLTMHFTSSLFIQRISFVLKEFRRSKDSLICYFNGKASPKLKLYWNFKQCRWK